MEELIELDYRKPVPKRKRKKKEMSDAIEEWLIKPAPQTADEYIRMVMGQRNDE